MNEEELFCKLFPEYAVNGKPLSPYFDLFESGYEQSEKRIAELEKKNTALRQDWEIMKNTISEYNDFCDKYISLEKENAELKKKVENLQKYLDTRNCYRECAETWLKLTKAKDLLKRFIELENCTLDYDDIKEAEQFLKDSEVEK